MVRYANLCDVNNAGDSVRVPMDLSASDPVTGPVRAGDLLWTPTPDRVASANMTAFMGWLKETRGLEFTNQRHSDLPVSRLDQVRPREIGIAKYLYVDLIELSDDVGFGVHRDAGYVGIGRARCYFGRFDFWRAGVSRIYGVVLRPNSSAGEH